MRNRWLPLTAAALSMMLIGLYQYSWTIFAIPLQQELHATATTIQLTFTIFTWVSTWTQPLVGLVADRRGPLRLNIFGGTITGFGWVASAFANAPETLYLTYGVGSVGVGTIYATAIGTAARWFPDRRGLATGIVIFGFGFGAAIFNPIISWIISTLGLSLALLYMGTAMLLILVVLSLFSHYPPLETQPTWNPNTPTKMEETKQYSPKEMVKTHQWWLLYSAFILTANTGLMVVAQLTHMGSFFSIPTETVVLTSAIFPFTNGIGRIVGGWISDKIGRQRTMIIYFTLQGMLTLMLLLLGSIGAVFVAVVATIGFLWGPIFTFFPAVIADYYGRRNSTVNYGLTYTAKGWGGLLGGYIASLLSSLYGGFTAPILASAALSFIGTLLVFPKVLNKPLV